MQRRFLFIINNTAGSGKHNGIEGVIEKAADRYSTAYTIVYTRAPGHATLLSRNAIADGYDVVVAVGGDGTVNEVAQGLVGSSVPMGLIARGSGNGLARHLGVSMNTLLAIDEVFGSNSLAIDTFTVNDRLSVNISGVGFDGHVADLFGRMRKRGFISYIKVALAEFRKFQSFNSTMIVDGGESTRSAFIIAIANSSQYGNNARIAPMASVMDGRLHMNIVRKVPAYRVDFLYSLFQGDVQKSSFCEIIEFQTSAVIRTAQPMPLHIDGEPAGRSREFRIKVNPGSLNVLVPRLMSAANT